jgi:hypothetical protein
MPQYEFPTVHSDPQKDAMIRDVEFKFTHVARDKWNWFRNYEIIDSHRYENDFDVYAAGDWHITTTEDGSGDATEALGDGANGILVITNDDADNDTDELELQGEGFKLVAGYPLYAEIRCKVSTGVLAGFWFGLNTGGAGWYTGTNDYVVFKADEDAADLEFVAAKDGTATTVDTGINLADDTYFIVGFHFDGAGTLRWFVFTDGDFPQTCVATGSVTTNIPDDEELALGFGVKNGEAVAKVLTVDYVKCVQRRVRE